MSLRRSSSCGNLSCSPQAAGEQAKSPSPRNFVFNRLSSSLNCDMCVNYESRLQQYQESERRLRQQLTTLQNLNEQYKTELSAERLQRKDTESALQSLRESVEKQLQETGDVFKAIQLKQNDAQELLARELRFIRAKVGEVLSSRLKSEEKFQSLSKKYDALLGRHRQRSQQLQAEVINLPQTVDELHILCLQLKEELLESRIAEEHLEESLRSDLIFVKSQLESELQSKEQLEVSLTEDVNSLRTELAVAQSQLADRQMLLQWKADTKSRLVEQSETINELQEKMKTLEVEKRKVEEQLQESKNRANALQKELDNCVQVQRDFVHLSQSLQVQLEKIRQSEHEVRWEEEEDVLVCRGCKQVFNRQRRKIHCRHCGRIFCEACLNKSVPSGSHSRPAKVCEVCHTLLVRDTAPYFSVEVPQSQLDGS
ncbi:FYVE zinc finger family protein [Trichuris trichiura]|uniref:FYVE zinc finger family protein n=1 Tax=Trichuris trichiura TaxID=36087 RepID=A0A077Z0P8_TRITR|nr:FYVE zinc finger family protein [Trichuris trichiura]